ncbi:MAG TPA: hypothetical protein VF169_03655 [Albitalea sp.]|uniref:hypothetical protein n=1 Tax=Piscinibacter sp. TaxID=1903157 RepID=UPI002ED4B2FA
MLTSFQSRPEGWRPSAGDLADQLGERLEAVLQLPRQRISLAPLGSVVPRLDAAAVLRVTDTRGPARAVVMCSSPDAPDMVDRAMTRASQAKALLLPAQGRHILDPLAEGRVQGLSYAVLPHCDELAHGRIAWRLQRGWLAPALFDWLWHAHAATVREVDAGEHERRYGEPLRALARLARLREPVRHAAQRAAHRLLAGVWHPRSVLMHGDLWKGNVLLRPAGSWADLTRWRGRFVVIDWPGAEPRGHAVYDLVRLALSMRLGRRGLAQELQRHAQVLGCEREDTMSHLLAALGQMALVLEHFPMDMFIPMVESCHACLAEQLD